MIILAHRGCWPIREQANTIHALESAYKAGFGIETDVRDFQGRLVVSHDPSSESAASMESLLEAKRSYGSRSITALNIKADGLAPLLRKSMSDADMASSFFFDMSGPETLRYRDAGLPYFTRVSDIEPSPVLYDDAQGVWLDMFYGDWCARGDIERHLLAGKRVCVVSPELHGRPHLDLWDKLQDWELSAREGMMLCTDYPDQADRFFNE